MKPKTGLEKLVEWLDGQVAYRADKTSPVFLYRTLKDKVDTLLSEEQNEWKAKYMKDCTEYDKMCLDTRIEQLSQCQSCKDSLVEELKNYCNNRGVCDCRNILEILSRHQEGKPRESLAELADRKGFIVIRQTRRRRGDWEIELHNFNMRNGNTARIGKTYQEAEQKAVTYLNGLPDYK